MINSDRGNRANRHGWTLTLLPLACLALAGCSSLGGSGPNPTQIKAARKETLAGAQITIVDVTDAAVRRMIAAGGIGLFSQTLGDAPPTGNLVGPGDVLEVTIWEAPPAGSCLERTRVSGAPVRPTSWPPLPDLV